MTGPRQPAHGQGVPTWQGPVRVVAYDPAWPGRFEREAAAFRAAIPAPLARIEHIGSTSVPGLAAKPVIDVLVGVASVESLDGVAVTGYHVWGEHGITGRRFFTRAGPDGRRICNLHAFALDDPGFARHLAFRDYLRAHPAVADEYGGLKLRVAAAAPGIDAYMDGKDAFIKRHEALALAWSRGGA